MLRIILLTLLAPSLVFLVGGCESRPSSAPDDGSERTGADRPDEADAVEAGHGDPDRTPEPTGVDAAATRSTPLPPAFLRVGGPGGTGLTVGQHDPIDRDGSGASRPVLTALPEGDERTPTLPWRFEVTQLSGWMPGPRGLAIDAAGVLWSYDHSRDPWIPTDVGGDRVTAAELADKLAGAVPRFVLAPEVLAAMTELVPAAREDHLVPHAPWTLDLTQTYLAFDHDPETDAYTEVVLASTGESRRGDATRLLNRWGECFLAPGSRPRPDAPAGFVASLLVRTEEFLGTPPRREDR